MVVFGTAMLAALLQLAVGQDPNCDYSQIAELGREYYIYDTYPRNTAKQCRWIGICPSGSRCQLNCPRINLPASSGCSMDRLLISRSGDPQLNGADVYCGRGSTSVVSTGQRISVGLITSSNTSGGNFSCVMKAVETTTPTPPPPPTCSCGYKKSNRIVGGQETGVNEYPMMAGVVYIDQAEIRCGGTIIDKQYVVTAAHCVADKQPNDLAVVVGEHDTTTGDSPATQGFRVEYIVTHPQYRASNYDYDVAILRLARNITFSDRVGPACMPFKFTNKDFTGSNFTLLGWGTLGIGMPKSTTLRKVDVSVISQSSCQQKVSALTARQICTYSTGKDACQDDSGGPALYTDPATTLLFLGGIISFGRSCAEYGEPGVHTRVPAVLDWVERNSRGAEFCRK